MAEKIKDLIKYEGINSCLISGNGSDAYKQFSSEGMLCIPECKPDVEQIVKVWADVEVIHQEVVRTPVGVSLEGQVLTGLKLFAAGRLNLKIQYVALNEERSVHTAHFTIPVCEYIVLPATSGCGAVKEKVYIEDIHVKLMDVRCFFFNVMVLMQAKLM